MLTPTQSAIHTAAREAGWKTDWDNAIQFRVERGDLIVHVEWTLAGRVRCAFLERRIRANASVVVEATQAKGKLDTVQAWIGEAI
jgi:hypothetical protein